MSVEQHVEELAMSQPRYRHRLCIFGHAHDDRPAAVRAASRRGGPASTRTRLRVRTLARTLALALVLTSAVGTPARAAGDDCPPLLDHVFRPLAGASDSAESLCRRHAGKVLLVVNTASYCGFTPQFEGLEALYRRYRARGLVVLGFPSNDFAQDPDSERDIKAFCELTYDVGFPMYEKVSVAGGNAHPFFRRLAETGGGAPRWNFHKYLIGRDGRQVIGFATRTRPDDPALLAALERLL